MLQIEVDIAISGANIDVAWATRIWDSIVDVFPSKKPSSASIMDWGPVDISNVAVCAYKVVFTPLQLGKLCVEPLTECMISELAPSAVIEAHPDPTSVVAILALAASDY